MSKCWTLSKGGKKSLKRKPWTIAEDVALLNAVSEARSPAEGIRAHATTSGRHFAGVNTRYYALKKSPTVDEFAAHIAATQPPVEAAPVTTMDAVSAYPGAASLLHCLADQVATIEADRALLEATVERLSQDRDEWRALAENASDELHTLRTIIEEARRHVLNIKGGQPYKVPEGSVIE